uniref:Uncharacterized protein n=1 Tax=Solanum lycopersicum TaxID=4081 RepID=A0A3Q7F9J3_SOLLC
MTTSHREKGTSAQWNPAKILHPCFPILREEKWSFYSLSSVMGDIHCTEGESGEGSGPKAAIDEHYISNSKRYVPTKR